MAPPASVLIEMMGFRAQQRKRFATLYRLNNACRTAFTLSCSPSPIRTFTASVVRERCRSSPTARPASGATADDRLGFPLRLALAQPPEGGYRPGGWNAGTGHRRHRGGVLLDQRIVSASIPVP